LPALCDGDGTSPTACFLLVTQTYPGRGTLSADTASTKTKPSELSGGFLGCCSVYCPPCILEIFVGLV
jgi:hypothetical protein